MPKVIGYTPPWLSRPSPGARIFSDPAPQSPASPSKRASYVASPSASSTNYQGPKRLVANRGSEVFTVVGNKIRWADLARVKDDWEEHSQSQRGRDGAQNSGKGASDDSFAYRTLSTPVYYQIRQLSISPSGAFLAICTEHTVHIAVLPDVSRLSDQDHSPLKLKTYQLGPTTHVIPESPLASVLWHPLAASTPSTDCLVTVTAEAAVRMWELDRSNQWSFERPALAIDLRKLADGVSCDQDFEPSGFGKNRGFSVDDFDMEASAACFGGQGSEVEDAWSSMTLWTVMRNGDVYALCPLLPSKWQPTSTTIPSLSTSAVSRMATIAEEDTDPDHRRAADQQYEWVQEIDNDEPLVYDAADGSDQIEIRLRPQNPSAIPRLQGPFEVDFDDEDADIEVSDIYVFPPTLDENDLWSGEDDYEDLSTNVAPGIPFTSVCLATSNGQVHIAIDLESVSGQWLPKKGRSTFSVPLSQTKELTLVESLSLNGTASLWPTFTMDPVHRHSLFVTSGTSIRSLSFGDWISRVTAELSGEGQTDPGLQTRLEIACQGKVCVNEEVLSTSEHTTDVVTAPVVIDDMDLGYFLLACASHTAYVVSFDQTHLRASTVEPTSPELASTSPGQLNNQLVRITDSNEMLDEDPLPTRAPYAPPHVFDQDARFPIHNLRDKLPSSQKRALAEHPLKLSPALLDVVTSAHRTVAKQTAELESAAAELFRRCERLREELGDQVKQMSELADRLQHLHGSSDRADGQEEHRSHDERIAAAKEKQTNLVRRYEVLRRKVGRVGTANQELTGREIGWVDEINALGDNVGRGDSSDDSSAPLSARFQTVKQLAQDLLAETRRLEKSRQEDLATSKSSINSDSNNSNSNASGVKRSDSTPRRSGVLVSSRFQKEKIADVMAMVEREGAVIEAVMARLEKLNVRSS